MFIHDLFEQQERRLVVVYPGRFQPFHLGHLAVFQQLQGRFGRDNVFVGYCSAQRKKESKGNPKYFDGNETRMFMHAVGIDDDRIKDISGADNNFMYGAAGWSKVVPFDPANTVLILAIGAPDAEKLELDAVYTEFTPTGKRSRIPPGKQVGDEKPLKSLPKNLAECDTANKFSYVTVVPEVHKQIEIGGEAVDVSHGRLVRAVWNRVRKNARRRAELLQQMFGRNDAELGRILDKIPVEAIKESINTAKKKSLTENDDDLFADSKRFELLNKARKDPKWAYEYALNRIRGRWSEAEHYIMQDPRWAYEYAENVIKGRWSEAEHYIMQDPVWAYCYAKKIINGRWPEAEPYIMKDAQWAYWYARNVIRGRWPEAEPRIMQSMYAKDYKKLFKIRGKLKENDDDLFADSDRLENFKNIVADFEYIARKMIEDPIEYAAEQGWDEEDIDDKIIDDVMGAGHVFSELADTFRRNGMETGLLTLRQLLRHDNEAVSEAAAFAIDEILDQYGIDIEQWLDESDDDMFADSDRVPNEIRRTKHPFADLGVDYDNYDLLVDLLAHCAITVNIKPHDREEMADIFMWTVGQQYGGSNVCDVVESIIRDHRAGASLTSITVQRLHDALAADYQQGYLKPADAVSKLDGVLGKALYAVEDASDQESLKPWGRDRELDENDDDLFAERRDNVVHDFSAYDDPMVYDLTQSDEDIEDGDILKLDNRRWAIMVDFYPVMAIGQSSALHKLDSENGHTFLNIDDGKYAGSYYKLMALANRDRINENDDDLFAPSDRLQLIDKARKDPLWALDYADDVIVGRWPEAEPYIMRDPKLAYVYAKNVIGGRWPAAEPVIMKDPKCWEYYKRYFKIQDDLTENDDDLFAEPTIRFDQAFNEYDEDELQKMGFAYGDHPELDVEIINNYIRGHHKWRVLKITGGEHDLTLHLDKLSGLKENDDDLFAPSQAERISNTLSKQAAELKAQWANNDPSWDDHYTVEEENNIYNYIRRLAEMFRRPHGIIQTLNVIAHTLNDVECPTYKRHAIWAIDEYMAADMGVRLDDLFQEYDDQLDESVV